MISGKRLKFKSLTSNLKKNIKILDIVVFILLISLSLYLFLSRIVFAEEGSRVIIYTPNKEYEYDLSNERILHIEGKIGTSTIQIENGKIKFVDSPCPGKHCIHMGEISKSGESIACLPNGIYIVVEGESENDLDIITY